MDKITKLPWRVSKDDAFTIEAKIPNSFDWEDIGEIEYPPDAEYICRAVNSHEGLVQSLRSLFAEVDCRIEHGAESGGHLEYVREKLKEALKAADGEGVKGE